MSLLDQLKKGVKLKTSDVPTKDYSDPKLAGFASEEEEVRRYQNSVIDVNIESWIHILEDVTFPTSYCSISIEDALLFIEIYKRCFDNRETSCAESVKWRETLDAMETKRIVELEGRLQETMGPYLEEDGHVFVKTSSRSAKDAPIYQTRFKTIYKDEIKRCKDDIPDDLTENDRITCLLKAAFQVLKMDSATLVIDTFVSSERIYQDMLLATELRDRFHENFVIRKFMEIEVDMEFRGFVFDGVLTALSQYNYLICSSRLVALKDAISRKIRDFYRSEVAPKLSTEPFPRSFIIDFAICDLNEPDERIWVIEINPFQPTTDGALFSWEHERHLLENTENYEFRITTKPKPGAKTMLPTGVRSILDSCGQ